MVIYELGFLFRCVVMDVKFGFMQNATKYAVTLRYAFKLLLLNSSCALSSQVLNVRFDTSCARPWKMPTISALTAK